MISRLIELAMRNRALVVALYLGLAAWGYWALLSTPVDAIPDLSDNQVIVFTDWAGRSPQEVEDQVTYPLVTNLQGLPGVRVETVADDSPNGSLMSQSESAACVLRGRVAAHAAQSKHRARVREDQIRSAAVGGNASARKGSSFVFANE